MQRRCGPSVRMVALSCAAIACSLSQPDRARAGELAQRNDFGEVGLLDMPSARMAPDGQLSFTLSALPNTQRINLGFQILPWLEGSFRYSRIAHLRNGQPEYDRSFGLKMRLFEEGEYVPDISVGIRDIVGTGIYGAEYLVATKQFWDFDVSAGLGWGRLASNGTFRNPLGLLSQSFDKRATFTTGGQGGTVNLSQFFHGPDAGIFGGVVWHTPIENLNLTVEYSSDRYLQEVRAHNNTVRSQLNIGLTYYPFEEVGITAGWLYGDMFGGTLSFALDPTAPATAAKLSTPALPATMRTDDQQKDAVAELVNSAYGIGAPQIHNASWHGAANSMQAPSNVEIDGRVLLADVHASGHGGDYCRAYAQKAAASDVQIDSIAITDLDDLRGPVAFCDVPGGGAKARLIAASARPGELPQNDSGSIALALAGPPGDAFDVHAAEQKIRNDAAAQSLRVEAVSIGEREATVYYSNTRYEFEAAALGRMVRVLMADTPPSVEIFRLVPVYFGRPTQDVQILRAPLERMLEEYGATLEMRSAIGIRPAPLDNPVLDAANEYSYPRFSWSVGPSMRQGLFDPRSPLRIQVFAAIDGSVQLLPGLSLDAQYEVNIYNTFSGATPSTSVLPHVRSDFSEYLTKGKYGFGDLDMVYRARLAPDLFAEAKVGYLEDMFAGAGGQVLWRPEGGRWALGADLYDVWQRDFNRLFGLRPYHVLTGHVSIYYQSPWHDINVSVHAGRYLAGDDGLTLELSRRFDTGVEVGAFATFTNVPFAKFGEGSFDKGITIRIPLEWALPFSTQSAYNLVLRPITRDGGQRLAGDDSLYEETRRTSYDEITEHADNIAHP